MTIQKRSILVSVIFAFAFVLYGTGKYYSPSLILYVVEQSLIQKSPSGMDRIQLQNRLRAYLSAASDQNARTTRLLGISMYLEKVQHLTPGEIDKLLAIQRP